MGSLCWSRFVGRTCGLCWSSLFLKDCSPWKGPTLKQFMKNCSSWEGLMFEKFVEDCLLSEGPRSGAGEECEEEGVGETCDELTTTPIPRPHVLLGGGGRENWGWS